MERYICSTHFAPLKNKLPMGFISSDKIQQDVCCKYGIYEYVDSFKKVHIEADLVRKNEAHMKQRNQAEYVPSGS